MPVQYNAGNNPFLSRLNQLAGQQGNSQPAPGVNAAAMQSALGAQAGQSNPNQANGPQTPQSPAQAAAAAPQGQPGQPGQPGGAGTTKILLTAMQALHQFTLQGADPQEVAVVRSMIVILNQLIQRDQMNAQQQGGQGGPQAGPGGPAGGPTPNPAAQQPGNPTGQVSAAPGQSPLG
jgi:hypothetical protein